MANDTHNNIEIRTRSNVTYILIIGGMLMLGYIVYRWGQEKEILTLIIGLIGGTILGMPLGTYYSAYTGKKSETPIIQTGDSPTATTGEIKT